MVLANKDEYKYIIVDELGLSVRSSNALRRANIHTLYQLVEVYNDGMLLDIRNLGKNSFEEIKGKMFNIAEYGIETDFSDINTSATEEYIVPEEIENIAIRDLQISVRLMNCLIRGGYQTVGSMLRITTDEFLNIRNAGAGTLKELRTLIAEIREKGITYFEDRQKVADEEIDEKYRRSVDIATVQRLRESYGFKTVWLTEWYGVTRQRVSQMLDKRINRGNWLNREFGEIERTLLSEMLDKRLTITKDEEGNQAYYLNNKNDDCAVIYVSDEEIKCFFLDNLPEDLRERIRTLRLECLVPEEMDVASIGKSVFILKKEYFIPHNSMKFHQMAGARNLSVDEYSLFLTGLPLTTAQSTVTDEKILEFLSAHYVDGRLMIPSNNSTQWFRSFISRNGYTIDEIAELYGLENMDGEFSSDEVEDDMREYEGNGDWLHDLYAQNPLIGNKRISEKTKDKLYSITKKYVDQILRQPAVQVPLTAKMQITLMIITFAKEWDTGDDSGFWRYITAQFGYRDDTGRLRGILCDYVLEAMQRNHRWFISSATGYQYKSTIVTHALTTKRSWMRLYDFLFDFYKENMDWTYVEDDPIVYRMVEALKNKLIAGDESDDGSLEISNKVYSFQEGIRKLIIYRTGYASQLISDMLHRIDDLVNHVEEPAKFYVEELCDQWIEGRLKSAQESKSREQTVASRNVAVDYTRIRPIYTLTDETNVKISLPDVRLKKTEFDRIELRVYAEENVVERRSLQFYGNELGKTLSGFEIDVDKCVRNGNGDVHLRVILCCDDEEIYDSGESLYRKILCFAKDREVSIGDCGRGAYSIFIPRDEQLDFVSAEVSQIEAGDAFNAYFVRLDEDFIIRCGNMVVSYDVASNESGSGIRSVLPKTLAGVSFTQNGRRFGIITECGTIHIIVPENYDDKKSRILMNGIQIVFAEMERDGAGSDFVYKLPVKVDSERCCEFEIIDLENNRVVVRSAWKYLPGISWQFDKAVYYSQNDYEKAHIRFFDGQRTYTERFGEEQDAVEIDAFDGTLDIKIPRLSVRNSLGEVWENGKRLWLKDIQQNDKLYISSPSECEISVKVGDVDVAAESNNCFALGNAVFAYSSASSDEWIDISIFAMVDNQLKKYVIGRMSEVERFVSSVKFEYRDQTLFWNRGIGFVGNKDCSIKLIIQFDGGEKSFLLDLENEVAIDTVDLPLGEYQYRIVKDSENIFSMEEIELDCGELIIGDKNALRYRNSMINITHITNEDEGHLESIEINGTYIENLEYQGIQYVDSEGRDCAVYIGEMFYMGMSGKHHAFSDREGRTEKGHIIYKINPVKVVYINEHTLSITNEDGDGIYYYRHYNRDKMANVYMVTDREPDERNQRNYYLADLYIYQKERI